MRIHPIVGAVLCAGVVAACSDVSRNDVSRTSDQAADARDTPRRLSLRYGRVRYVKPGARHVAGGGPGSACVDVADRDGRGR